MTAHTPWFAYPVLDQTAVHQLTTLCAELQSDVRTLQCQVMELEQQLSDSRAMLDAVFTIETEPAAAPEYTPPADECRGCDGFGYHEFGICERCNGSGLVRGWEALADGLTLHCATCNGTGKVQS